jgi:putative transcriptional regulator
VNRQTNNLTLLERIDRLEKQNRRFKQAAVAVALIAVAVVTMGQVASQKTVEVNGFLIKDSGGKTPVHAAQDKPNKGDSDDEPLFLVARPELDNPIFKESVVLMFPSSVGAGEGPVVGLIVNKPARVALSEIFPNDEALKNRSETAYFGGPVDPRAPGVVFRSSTAAKQAALLFGDVYVSFDPDFIKELLKKPEKTPDLRLFVGRSEWAPAQLQNEMVKGAWYSVRAETNLIFSASPQYLWRNLSERAEPAPIAKVTDVPFGLSAFFTNRSDRNLAKPIGERGTWSSAT